MLRSCSIAIVFDQKLLSSWFLAGEYFPNDGNPGFAHTNVICVCAFPLILMTKMRDPPGARDGQEKDEQLRHVSSGKLAKPSTQHPPCLRGAQWRLSRGPMLRWRGACQRWPSRLFAPGGMLRLQQYSSPPTDGVGVSLRWIGKLLNPRHRRSAVSPAKHPVCHSLMPMSRSKDAFIGGNLGSICLHEHSKPKKQSECTSLR